MNDNLLTIQDAAKHLKVHWQTIRNYIDKGLLKPIKIGRTIRIRKEDLEQFADDIPAKREVELRYILKDKTLTENKLRALGAKLTNHSHIIDHYYCQNYITNMQEKDQWFDSPTGFAPRIRQIDNDYSGKIITTLEVKKLAGPDYKDHSNCLEAEIEINNFRDAERLVLMMNHKKFMIFDKERFVYRLGEIKFCFDSITNFGDGLEIEKMTTEPIEKVKRELTKLAAKLDLSEKDMPRNSLTYEVMLKLAKF
jgi:predicted adenylyl cyclase CyaB